MANTHGVRAHQDSPRPPPVTRLSSSRPAIRIRRLQPLADGQIGRGGLSTVPENVALSPIPPAAAAAAAATPRGPFAKVKSKLGGEHAQRVNAIHDALEPGEVATVVRDGRGQPMLAAVPEHVISPTGHGRHPDPRNSIPLPADSVRGDNLIATETPPTSGADGGQLRKKTKQKWWPFGKHKDEQDEVENPPPVVRDYGAADPPMHHDQYAEDIVDWLDVIDPEVATVSTLSNVQNSLFLPDLGNLYNRMPIIDLSRRRRRKKPRRRSTAQKMKHEVPHVSAFAEPDEIEAAERARAAQTPQIQTQTQTQTQSPEVMSPHRDPTASAQWIDTESLAPSSPDLSRHLHAPQPWVNARHDTSGTFSSAHSHTSSSSSDSSTPDESEMRRRERLMRSVSTIRGEYAVLPAGIAWDDWSEDEKRELDDHVRHLMHSRRERFRRSMRGFRRFVSRPLGFLITLYAFLITFWGAAWVLFLIGWIYLGDRKGYFVEIADQILTALFCVVGIGLAPFRAVDTYHMIYIAHYHHLTWRLRREQNLPKLNDRNDLPAPSALDPDLEAQFQKEAEKPVLTPKQQEKLTYHQEKYHKSHTFYRPHETPTHKAFPLSLLIAITVLLDCHSLLQMSLGGTTWGIYYKRRPSALTATILSCSISCNLTAGFLISLGGRKTRKREEVEKRVRQALTAEAMRRLEKQKREEEALARGEPVGLQASIKRVQEKVKGEEGEESRPLTREESKSKGGERVPPEHMTVPQMP